MSTFADRLIELRKKNDLTMGEFCELIDTSYGTVYNWIHDGTVPRAAAIKKIAAALDVTEEWLLNGEGEIKSREKPEETTKIMPSGRETPVRSVYSINNNSVRYRAEDEQLLRDINTVISQIKYMDLPRDKKKSIHKTMSKFRMEYECKVFYGDDERMA